MMKSKVTYKIEINSDRLTQEELKKALVTDGMAVELGAFVFKRSKRRLGLKAGGLFTTVTEVLEGTR